MEVIPMSYPVVWLLYAVCFVLLVLTVINIYGIDKKDHAGERRRYMMLKRGNRLFWRYDVTIPNRIAVKTFLYELFVYVLFVAMLVLLAVSYWLGDFARLLCIAIYGATVIVYTIWTAIAGKK